MQINKIKLTNFTTFEDFEFDIKKGKYLICGDNGVGKSTLLVDSINFGLFNVKRSKDLRFDKDLETASVEIHLQSGDDNYTIERIQPDYQRRCPIITKNGEELNFKKSSLREDEVTKILGISYDVFAKTVTLKQNAFFQSTNFANASPTVRKTIIEDIVGYQIWDSFRKPFTKKIRNQVSLINDLEKELYDTESSMIGLNARITTLEEVTEESEIEASNELSRLKEDLEDYQFKIAKIKQINPEISNLRNIEKDLNHIVYKVSDLKKSKDLKKCNMCKRDYPLEYLEQLEEIYKNTVSQKTKLSLEFKRLNDLKSISDSLDSKIYNLKSKIKDLENSKPKDDTNINKDRAVLAELVDAVNVKKENINDLKEVFDDLNYIDSLLTPSSDFRTYVLSNQIATICQIANEVKRYIYPEVTFDLYMDQKGIQLYLIRQKDRLEYTCFSGGERKRIDLILVFTFQKYLADFVGFRPSFVCLDEIFDSLDLKGINDILNTLDFLYSKDMSIFIISHKEEIKQAFDYVLKLKKGENGTYLEQDDYNS